MWWPGSPGSGQQGFELQTACEHAPAVCGAMVGAQRPSFTKVGCRDGRRSTPPGVEKPRQASRAKAGAFGIPCGCEMLQKAAEGGGIGRLAWVGRGGSLRGGAVTCTPHCCVAPSVANLQVLTASYLSGGALTLPPGAFRRSFPETTAVTLRNDSEEEWDGKVTCRPLSGTGESYSTFRGSCNRQIAASLQVLFGRRRPEGAGSSRSPTDPGGCSTAAVPPPPPPFSSHGPAGRSFSMNLTGGWGIFAKANGLRVGDEIRVTVLPSKVLLISLLARGNGSTAAELLPQRARANAVKAAATAGAKRQQRKRKRPGCLEPEAEAEHGVEEGAQEQQQQEQQALLPPQDPRQRLQRQRQGHQQKSAAAVNVEEGLAAAAGEGPALMANEQPYIRYGRGSAGTQQAMEEEEEQQQQQQLGSPYSGSFELPVGEGSEAEDQEAAAVTKRAASAVVAAEGGSGREQAHATKHHRGGGASGSLPSGSAAALELGGSSSSEGSSQGAAGGAGAVDAEQYVGHDVLLVSCTAVLSPVLLRAVWLQRKRCCYHFACCCCHSQLT